MAALAMAEQITNAEAAKAVGRQMSAWRPTAIEIPLQCPARGKTHNWKPEDAWVKGNPTERRRLA